MGQWNTYLVYARKNQWGGPDAQIINRRTGDLSFRRNAQFNTVKATSKLQSVAPGIATPIDDNTTLRFTKSGYVTQG
jgi:hypothetical protein